MVPLSPGTCDLFQVAVGSAAQTTAAIRPEVGAGQNLVHALHLQKQKHSKYGRGVEEKENQNFSLLDEVLL